MQKPALTIQLCTYNRADLLERVLRGCFEQTTSDYEVVLVNDGSTDHTEAVIAAAKEIAPIPFTVVTQANAGLARGRNVGIARAQGRRIAFIDDDVLPMPNFVAEHLRTDAEHPEGIVRGAVIITPSFDRLPPPIYSLKHYSGNFFWTSNVSVPLETLHRVGLFNESFREYGWEDIELGLRLRFAGVRGYFNAKAITFHFKAPLKAAAVTAMIAQSRAQARTALELAALHSHWRVALAIGSDPFSQTWQRIETRFRHVERDAATLTSLPPDYVLSPAQTRQARRLAKYAYYEELARASALQKIS